jgi:hypothetical protein
MADEQYRWLDRDMAERLLRGEPPGTAVTARAERLARALDALTAGLCPELPADEPELPGEAAALAAFRKVRAEAADAAQSAGTARAGRGGGISARRSGFPPADAGLVRLGGRPGARAHEQGGRPGHPVRRRPVRLVLSAALAASAIGALAVATAEVLPTPFRDARPSPAASVSDWPTPDGPAAAASPDVERELPATGKATHGFSGAAGRDTLRGESTAGPRTGEHDGRDDEPGPSHRPGEPGRGDKDASEHRVPGLWGRGGAGEKDAHGGNPGTEGRTNPTRLTGEIRSDHGDQDGAGDQDGHDGHDGRGGQDGQEGDGGGNDGHGLAPDSGHTTGRNDEDHDEDGEHGRDSRGHHSRDRHGGQGDTRHGGGNGHGNGSGESAGDDGGASADV